MPGGDGAAGTLHRAGAASPAEDFIDPDGFAPLINFYGFVGAHLQTLLAAAAGSLMNGGGGRLQYQFFSGPQAGENLTGRGLAGHRGAGDVHGCGRGSCQKNPVFPCRCQVQAAWISLKKATGVAGEAQNLGQSVSLGAAQHGRGQHRQIAEDLLRLPPGIQVREHQAATVSILPQPDGPRGCQAQPVQAWV